MDEILNNYLEQFVVVYNKALSLEERYALNKSRRKIDHTGSEVYLINSEHLEIVEETKSLFDELTTMRIELADYDYESELFQQLTKVLNDCTLIQHYEREELDISSFLYEITSESKSEHFYPEIYKRLPGVSHHE